MTYNPNIDLEPQKTLNSQGTLEKKNRTLRKKNRIGGIMLPGYRLYCEAMVFKRV